MFRKCISRSLLFRSTVDDFFFNCCKRCLEAFISFLLGLLLAMVSPKFSGKPSPNVVPFWNIQTPLGDGWGVALFQEVLGRVNNNGQFGQQKTWTARCRSSREEEEGGISAELGRKCVLKWTEMQWNNRGDQKRCFFSQLTVSCMFFWTQIIRHSYICGAVWQF